MVSELIPGTAHSERGVQAEPGSKKRKRKQFNFHPGRRRHVFRFLINKVPILLHDPNILDADLNRMLLDLCSTDNVCAGLKPGLKQCVITKMSGEKLPMANMPAHRLVSQLRSRISDVPRYINCHKVTESPAFALIAEWEARSRCAQPTSRFIWWAAAAFNRRKLLTILPPRQ